MSPPRENDRPPEEAIASQSSGGKPKADHQDISSLAQLAAQALRDGGRRTCEAELRSRGVSDPTSTIEWMVDRFGWGFWVFGACLLCDPEYGAPHASYALQHLSNTGWKAAA